MRTHTEHRTSTVLVIQVVLILWQDLEPDRIPRSDQRELLKIWTFEADRNTTRLVMYFSVDVNNWYGLISLDRLNQTLLEVSKFLPRLIYMQQAKTSFCSRTLQLAGLQTCCRRKTMHSFPGRAESLSAKLQGQFLPRKKWGFSSRK